MAPERTDPMGKATRVIPAEEDLGKTVLDRQDQVIGLVSDVRGDTMYVDPESSVSDIVKAALRWENADEDDLSVPPNFVDYIEDDVVLSIERDERYREGAS